MRTLILIVILTLCYSQPVSAKKNNYAEKLEQCKKWFQLAEKYEQLRRQGINISTNRKKQREVENKFVEANCPARHNSYFKD